MKILILLFALISSTAFADINCKINSRKTSMPGTITSEIDGVIFGLKIQDGIQLMVGKNEGHSKSLPLGFFVAIVDSNKIDPFTNEALVLNGVFGAKAGSSIKLEDELLLGSISCETK